MGSTPISYQPCPNGGRMVREHAFRLYRDKLERSTLSLEDWVLAEKDLVQTRMNEGIERT